MDTKEAESTLFKVMRDLDAILPRNTSKSEINVNAGGVGIWIATTACLVMLAVNIFLVALLSMHDRKIDDLNHIVSAIYMVSPELKERIENGNPDHRDSAATAAEPTSAASDSASDQP